jgi:hypothetical protein
MFAPPSWKSLCGRGRVAVNRGQCIGAPNPEQSEARDTPIDLNAIA